MTRYFISDLHLDETRPDITHAFLTLLKDLQGQASQLFILGDFFESWIGDDESTPLQHTISAALRALSNSGTELLLMHGNRDFLIGEQFARASGCHLLDDPSVILHGTERVLLMHGDSLCSHDANYMKFRATIRNPNFLAPFLKRPLEERRSTAAQLRAMSKQNNRQKAADIMDVNPDEIPQALRAANAHLLIHGHTHRPAIHRFELDGQPSARVVLGDWDEKVWLIRQNVNQPLELCCYPLTGALSEAVVVDRI